MLGNEDVGRELNEAKADLLKNPADEQAAMWVAIYQTFIAEALGDDLKTFEVGAK